MEAIKVCSKCKTEKDKKYFYKNKSTLDGLTYYCKSCRNQATKKYIQNNREKSITYTKHWRDNNQERFKKSQKEYYTSGKGVYGLFENGVCLYIGESSGLKGRIKNHIYGINHPDRQKNHVDLYKSLKNHNHIIIGIIEETNNHKEKEIEYTNQYNPLYNKER